MNFWERMPNWKSFGGFFAEPNYGSPGGWEYQVTAQKIQAAAWEMYPQMSKNLAMLRESMQFGCKYFYPLEGFVGMLLQELKRVEGSQGGLIAVVAEADTLDDVAENRNLVARLNENDGVSSALMAPQELELQNSRPTWRGQEVSLIFTDFNTDLLLKLHSEYKLDALLQAIKEGRVLNHRGLDPINGKEVFEVFTDPEYAGLFPPSVVARIPWTRKFYPRNTTGPKGEEISDLVEWTYKNWDNIILKPERLYSGKGVVIPTGDESQDVRERKIETALALPHVVQAKVPLNMFSEEFPGESVLQTDTRMFFCAGKLIGFLSRYGEAPVNVGQGGGMAPMAMLKDNNIPIDVFANLLNRHIGKLDGLEKVDQAMADTAMEYGFTYLNGPIRVSRRPRLVTREQIREMKTLAADLWDATIRLYGLWKQGLLKDVIAENDVTAFCRENLWQGSPSLLAVDGMFSFGAHPEQAK